MFIERRFARNIDIQFLAAVFALVAVGFVVIYSATHANTADNMGDPLYFIKKQGFGLFVGLILMVGVAVFDYRQLGKLNTWIYAFGLLALVAVLAVGREVSGSKSWIIFGPLRFQPSEVAKIAYTITLAQYLSNKESLASWTDLIGPFLHIGIPLGLIMLQPDLGTGLVFIAILFAMLYMAGAPANKLLVILLIGAALSPLAYMYGLKEYQRQRLLIFLDPYKDPTGFGYNVIQSTIAVGSGRLFGKGFLAGSQTQLNFLPEHHTDFIFSVVGEEWGFVGCIVLLILYFTLVWRGLRTATEARDMFGSLLVVGLTTMFLFHVLINVGMNMSAMPVTGIPLPFLSYGGSSLMTNLIAVGLILSVQARRQKALF